MDRGPYYCTAAAKSLLSCPTLRQPIDGLLQGSSVPGILQVRTLEWVAISFSSAWKWKVKVKSLSHAWLFTTPWTAAHQAPPSMGFSRQEYWSGLPLPSPNFVQEASKKKKKKIPKKKKSKKAKWLSEEALPIAEESREVKSKGEW